MNLRHKFHAKSVEESGIKFPSQRERNYFLELGLAQKSGELLFFLRQVPFDLGGGVRYFCDFLEFWANGDIRFVDTKGFRTPMYIAKKKLVEAKYPIQILEV
jgi:hypothetical protein